VGKWAFCIRILWQEAKMNSMKIAFVGLAAILSGSVGAFAAAISPQQAAANPGQNVIVEGVATVSEADGLPGLFVRLDSPSHAPFVGYIPANIENKFPDIQQLQGKTVDITGVVETGSQIPMIRLTSADQIKIVQ
jgi:hypothetical protein